MASGETIDGAVRVVREDTEGNTVRVFGPIDQERVDYANQQLSADNKLYLNTSLSDRKGKPTNAESQTVPDAQFLAGETLKVQHSADSSVSNDIEAGASGAYEIDTLVRDMNRNNVFPETLRAPDNEISGTVSESTSQFVTFYQFTVPDRQEYSLTGRFGAAALEN